MRAPALLLLCLLVSLEASAAPRKLRAPASRASRKKAAPAKAVIAKATAQAPEPAAPEPAPAPARASREPTPTPTGGSVLYLSSGGRVYLDRGREEGLEKGLVLALSRRGKAAGSCRVDWVADHRAVCQGQGPRPGDRFELPQREAAPGVAARPRPASTEELSRRKAVLDAAPQPLVESVGGTAGGERRPPVRVELGHTSWLSNTGGSFNQERVDVSLRGMPLGAGFRLSLDATAMAWTGRPDGFRSPNRAVAQLYVREGEVTHREPGQHLALAVGRVWPWYVPGVALFDGAQLGWRSTSGNLEVGGFGGGVPDPVKLEPSFQRLVAGAYVAGQYSGDSGSVLRLLQHEARVSFMSAPEYGQRVEAEGRVRAWLGKSADVGAWVRMGLGDAQAPGGVDAARLDVDVRPSETWRLSAGARYTGTMALDVPPPLDEPSLRSRTVNGDLTALWQPAPWLLAGVTGLLSRDIQTGIGRQLVGPEVGLPRLFGTMGGLSAGYLEELGWLRGRSAYLQPVLRPATSLRLLGRVSYFEEQPPSGITDMAATRDLGLYASTEYAPARWLTVRVSVLARFGVSSVSEGGLPMGLMGNASLAGAF